MKTQADIDRANAKFWEELCGTHLAKRLGITDRTEQSLSRFDEAYLRLYPYLKTYADRIELVGKRVLEIGLGYGTLGQSLAEKASDYIGVDISSGPVEMMNHRLQMCGLRGSAVLASAHQLPFEKESFDAVVSVGVFHHTGNVERCVEETRRVLKRGGRVLAMVYNRFSYRQLLCWPFKTASEFFSDGDTGEDTHRSVCDSRLDGTTAPETVFTSTRQLQRIFSAFSSVSISKENCDDITVQGMHIVPRPVLLATVGRTLGLDLYILATK